MEKYFKRSNVNRQLLSNLNMYIFMKKATVCFVPLNFSHISKALLFILITAFSFNAHAFEESIKLDIDKKMLNQRQELFDKYDSGKISRKDYFNEARNLEKGSKRSVYIDEMFNDNTLRVSTIDPKTGEIRKKLLDPKTKVPLEKYIDPKTGDIYDELPVFKRSGSPAVAGRGILSDEDIMINLDLDLTDKEMMEFYDDAMQKLKKKGVKIRVDSLATQTLDDVVIWNPTRTMRKSIGGKETYFITGVQFNEYAPGAMAGGSSKVNLIGLQEEIIMDNLNKGKTGFLLDPESWLHGDKKMTHKIWDELRLASKDTYRSLQVAGLKDDDKLKDIFKKYEALATGESMPSELGIYKRGASIEERLAGARKEMEKMRKYMKKSLKVSRKNTAKQIEDLLSQIEKTTSTKELERLRKLAQEAGDRMHRMALNYDFMTKQPGFSNYLKQMEFPEFYLRDLNKMSAKLRKLLDVQNNALIWFFMKNMSGDDLKKAIKAVLDDKLDDLPDLAKSLRNELSNVAGLRLINLESGKPQSFMVKLKKEHPSLKLSANDKSVHNMLKQMDTATESQMVRMFGKKSGPKLFKARQLMIPKVKSNVIKRYAGKLLNWKPWKVDKKTGMMILGDANETGIKALRLDAVIGIATAMYMTSNIMDQDLAPEEENRQVMNAWVTSLPMVGDFAQGTIDGIEAFYEGSSGKALKAGIFLTIGAAYVVPGAQIPALILSLGMVGYEISASAWDVAKDKNLIWTWLYSGKWNYDTGVMLGLFNANGDVLPVPPTSGAFVKLIDEGNIGYHSSHADEGVTIRDSIIDYAERAILKHDQNVEIRKMAIKNLYPGFDLDTNLREPVNIARTNFAAYVIEKGGNAGNDAAMALFADLKRKFYDPATLQAMKQLKDEAQDEFQAQYMVGEAAEVFERLIKLGQKLNLPLVNHVDAMFESFISWSMEAIKSPWVKHSIPLRHVELARKYLNGYLEIKDTIDSITNLIKKEGLKSPGNFNLTGYIDIDQPRIVDLKGSYTSAIADARAAVKTISNSIKIPGYKFDPDGPCPQMLFRKLAQLNVNKVHSQDWMDLMDQWSGIKSASQRTRDDTLKQIQNQIDSRTKYFKVSSSQWSGLWSSFESAYAWAHAGWISVVTRDSSSMDKVMTYQQAKSTIVERKKNLKDRYDQLVSEGPDDLLRCLATLTVHIRRKVEEEILLPILKAEVYLIDSTGKRLDLEDKEEGNYLWDKLPSGDYNLHVKRKGFTSLAGEEVAVVPLPVPVPTDDSPAEPIDKTILLLIVKGDISVVIADEEEMPVPNAQVSLEPEGEDPQDFIDCNNDGTYIFSELDPGVYKVHARADYYEDESSFKLIINTEDIVKSTKMPVSIVLVPFLSNVSVNVTDEDGNPFGVAEVNMEEWLDVTDPGGTLIFDKVPPTAGENPYMLTVHKEGYPVVNKEIWIKPDKNGETFTHNIKITPGGSIIVKVIDKDTQEPVKGASINLVKYDTKLGTSDETGSYTFEKLPPDHYYVEVSKEGYLSPDDKEVKIGLEGAPLEEEVTIDILSGIKLKVYVKDESTGELVDAQVSMDGLELRAPTGSCEFDRVTIDEPHTFVTWARCYSEKSEKKTFQSTPGQQSIDINLKPALSITVEVREDTPGGEFIKGPSRISLNGPQYSRDENGPVRTFSGLVKGTFTASISSELYTTGADSIAIDPDDDKCSYTLVLNLKKLFGNLSVSVNLKGKLEEGEAAPEIKISASGPGGTFSGSGSSESFKDLTKGTYSITASATGYSSASDTIEINPTIPGQSYSITLALEATEKPALTAEDLQKLIADGKLDEAKKILDGMTDDKKKELLSKLSDSDKKKIFGPDIPITGKFTAEDIQKLLADGKVDEANKLLQSLPPDKKEKMWVKLTDILDDDGFIALVDAGAGEDDKGQVTGDPTPEDIEKLLAEGKVDEANKLLSKLSPDKQDSMMDDLLGILDDDGFNALMTAGDKGKTDDDPTSEEIEKLVKAGKVDEAKKLLSKLSPGKKAKMWDKLEDTLDDDGYIALVDAVKGKGKVTDDPTPEEIEQLIKDGNVDEADKLLSKLPPDKMNKMMDKLIDTLDNDSYIALMVSNKDKDKDKDKVEDDKSLVVMTDAKKENQGFDTTKKAKDHKTKPINDKKDNINKKQKEKEGTSTADAIEKLMNDGNVVKAKELLSGLAEDEKTAVYDKLLNTMSVDNFNALVEDEEDEKADDADIFYDLKDELVQWKALEEPLTDKEKKQKETTLSRIDEDTDGAGWVKEEEEKLQKESGSDKKLYVYTNKGENGRIVYQYTYYLRDIKRGKKDSDNHVKHGCEKHWYNKKGVYTIIRIYAYDHGKKNGFYTLWKVDEYGKDPSVKMLGAEGYYKDDKRQGKITTYTDDGNGKAFKLRTVSYDNDIQEGLAIEYHWGGEKVQIKTYYKDGKLNGSWTEWFSDGHVKTAGNYKNGEKDGEWTFWKKVNKYSNELFKSLENYKNGRKDGKQFNYDVRGVKTGEANYKDGKKHGAFISYFKGRKEIERVDEYKDGKRVFHTMYTFENNKYRKCKEVDFLANTWKKWDYDGKVTTGKYK